MYKKVIFAVIIDMCTNFDVFYPTSTLFTLKGVVNFDCKEILPLAI